MLPDAISTIFYNFRDVIGTDPQGNTLFNVITDDEKDRAREIFEIYSDNLGLEAVETETQGLTVVHEFGNSHQIGRFRISAGGHGCG